VSQKALAIVIIIIIVVGIPWASRTSLRSATTSATSTSATATSATATSSAAAATATATTAVVSTPVVVVSVIVEVIVERVVVKIVAIVAIVITIPTTAVVRVEIIVVSGIAIVKSGIVGVVVIVVIEVVVIVVVVIVEVVVSGIAIIVVFSWASRSSLSASGRIVSRSTSNVKIAITCVIREIVGGAIAGRTVILLIPIFSRTSWPPLAWFGIVGVSVGIVRRSCGVTLFLEFSRHLNFHVLPQDLKNFTSIHVLASNVIQVIGVFKYHKTVTKWTIASNHDLE